jgi:hypothetical protein
MTNWCVGGLGISVVAAWILQKLSDQADHGRNEASERDRGIVLGRLALSLNSLLAGLTDHRKEKEPDRLDYCAPHDTIPESIFE